MTDQQLYLAIGVPVLVNTVMFTFLYLALAHQLERLRALMLAGFNELHRVIEGGFHA